MQPQATNTRPRSQDGTHGRGRKQRAWTGRHFQAVFWL